MADVVIREVQVETHPRPYGCVIDETCQRIRVPVSVAVLIVDAECDYSLRRCIFRPKQEFILDIDILSRIQFPCFDGDPQPIIHGGVANAYVLAFEGGAVGNDAEVIPRRIPGILILKIVGIQLGPCREPCCK